MFKNEKIMRPLAAFLMAALFMVAGASELKGHSRAGLCDNCPYSQLCDEAVVEGGLPLCEDPQHRDKFYVNETGDLVARPLTSEVAVSSVKTVEVSLAGGTAEATIEADTSGIGIVPAGAGTAGASKPQEKMPASR